MYKPRVVFPFTEAGMGHIVPLTAMADAFEKMYGDKVEVVRSQFFSEANQAKLKLFEDRLKSEVVHHNRHPSYGYFATMNMEFWGIGISSWATMKFLALGSRSQAYKHMAELKPDLVVSTHWATNYYARHIKNMPLTVMYCPDTDVNPLFSYPCDLVFVPTPTGYKKALKRHPVRFNQSNLKHVPYTIRAAAYNLEGADKRELRIKNGLDPDKFTIILAEGGYGIGKMESICQIILQKDLPVNLVPVCGKNEELYKKFLELKSGKKTIFRPLGFMGENIFEYMAASDIFCGKSGGSIMPELTFFGVPQIITKCATLIEKNIANYYVDYVKSAIKIFDAKATVEKIEEFMACPQKMEVYRQNALNQRDNYGAEVSAKLIFDLLCTRFPYLNE